MPDADAPPRQHHSTSAQPCRSPVAVLHRGWRTHSVPPLGNYLKLANTIEPSSSPTRSHRPDWGRGDIVRPLGPGDWRGHGVPRARSFSLGGSGITMKQNAENLRQALGLPEAVIRKLTLDNPRSRSMTRQAVEKRRLTPTYDVTENRRRAARKPVSERVRMHTPAAARDDATGRVFEGVTAYHWLVVIIASCGLAVRLHGSAAVHSGARVRAQGAAGRTMRSARHRSRPTSGMPRRR